MNCSFHARCFIFVHDPELVADYFVGIVGAVTPQSVKLAVNKPSDYIAWVGDRFADRGFGHRIRQGLVLA